MLRLCYFFTLTLVSFPLIPGLLLILLPALGYLPPLGMEHVSAEGILSVLNWPGLYHSVLLTFGSALTSTFFAAFSAFAILQRFWWSRSWHWVETLLAPLLALPHVAFAIGFAYLFSPVGILARLILSFSGSSPDAGSFWLVQDPYAAGLSLALTLKEIPFLVLMSLALLPQLGLQSQWPVAASMGYSREQFWWKVVLPQWWKRVRFPLFAVVAYSASVVDLSLILGPDTSPTFAVLVWQWFRNPDLLQFPRAAAGALLLLVISMLLLGIVVLAEKLCLTGFRSWQVSGRFHLPLPGKALWILLVLISGLTLPLLLLWSVAQRWPFPQLLPSELTLRFWQTEWTNIAPVLYQTLMIGVLSGTLALTMSVIAHEFRIRYRWSVPDSIIALPMLIPQLSLLFGIQVVALLISGQGYYWWVIWSHLFFAFPYTYLTLNGPWQSYPFQLSEIALSLGKHPVVVFWRIKLPLLVPALCYAWAVGVSVSLAQYLPTLLLGAGRVTTITIEAVAQSSGFDRRIAALYALWQGVLPLIFFSLSILASRFVSPRAGGRFHYGAWHDVTAQKHHH